VSAWTRVRSAEVIARVVRAIKVKRCVARERVGVLDREVVC
jgi:hypothetical protein